jgi:DNA-binding NarL/FixJ family response regulator
MSETALQLSAEKPLRVAIVAADATRRAALLRKLSSSSYVLVDSPRDADVVLCDGDATPAQIDAALRAVAVGSAVRPKPDRSNGFSEARADQRTSVGRSLLTPREVEMLSAIGSGLSNKAIARHLDISLHTVKFHIESLFRKLGARSRAEAVAKGLERSRSETVEL